MPCLALLFFSGPLHGQYDLIIEPKPPQADSREELDLYLNIFQLQDPKKVIESAAKFVRLYPDSEFLAQIRRLEMRSYLTLDDAENAVAAGEKLLSIRPRDAEAFLTLAKVLPRIKGNKDENLPRAEHYARSALQEIAALRAPRTITIKEFEKIICEMQSGVHEALGLIAFQRDQFSQSVTEFETSISLHPTAGGSLYYRLGVAYKFMDNRTKARVALRRAAELGPAVVRDLARVQLAELQRNQPLTEK